jgi:hypothetical protein
MRLAAILLILALAACGQREAGFAPGTEMNFMRACEARSETPGLCGCIWDRIEAEVPPDDFNALERLPGPEREAHPLTEQINGYAFACVSELTTEPAATP